MSLYGKLLVLAWSAAQVLSLNLRIEEFYSKSFVPNDIFVSYSLHNKQALSYNVTVKEHFPGKLLMHIFMRQLDDVPGGNNSIEMYKMKNLDFCKSLETLRNMTLEDYHSESLMPTTFLISCPLQPGFYYIDHGLFNEKLWRVHIKPGRYFAQFELIQVYEEVIKLLNGKIKLSKIARKEEQPQQTEEESSVSKEREKSGSGNDENVAEDSEVEGSSKENEAGDSEVEESSVDSSVVIN